MGGTPTKPARNTPNSRTTSRQTSFAGRLAAGLSFVGRIPQRIWRWICAGVSAIIALFKRVSLKIRIGFAIASVLLIVLGIFSWETAASARLRITCQHTFRSAALTVLIDDNPVYTGSVGGTAKKRLGVFKSNPQNTFAKTVAVHPGKHIVEVRLVSAADNFDQSKSQLVTFSDNKENLLTVSGGRHGLNILAQGGFTPPPDPPLSPYKKYASPVLFSILGSGLSATISFLVQEFLRGQKARLANSNSPAQIKS
jgi:hypothetical protein